MSARLGVALGLAAATAVAAWWLGASRVAIAGGANAATIAFNALFALLLVRASLIALLAPRAAAVGGYVAGLRLCLPVVSVGWPVVALAWAASNVGVAHALAAEVGLLAGAVLAPLVGRALARSMKQGPTMEAIATASGVLIALGLWLILTGLPQGS
jgi:hypothetical protein